MAVATSIVIAAGASALIGGGMAAKSASKAKKDQEAAAAKKRAQEDIIAGIEANRQEIVNPMEGLTNEAMKIGVATQAAEFQAEEADMALANTLDTLMATGSGGAGATALAQMALKSKQGISADIQKQEVKNAKNVANAQMAINQQKALGEKWAWEQQETRDMQSLDRAQNQADKFESQEYAAEAAKWEAYGQMANVGTQAIGSVAGGFTGGGSMIGGS